MVGSLVLCVPVDFVVACCGWYWRVRLLRRLLVVVERCLGLSVGVGSLMAHVYLVEEGGACRLAGAEGWGHRMGCGRGWFVMRARTGYGT